MHTLDCKISLLKVLTPSRVVSEKCLVCSHRSFLNLSIYCFYSTSLFVSHLRKRIQRGHGLESHENVCRSTKLEERSEKREATNSHMKASVAWSYRLDAKEVIGKAIHEWKLALTMEPMETYFPIGLVDHLSSATTKHVRRALKASTMREHIWVLVELATHSFVWVQEDHPSTTSWF